MLGEVQGVEEPTLTCMVSWEQHGQDSNPGPDFHITSDWLRLLPRGVSAHVATLAVMVPLWPGSALLLSPSSRAGLAHSRGSFISLYTCFPLFGLVYQEHVFFWNPCLQAKQWKQDAWFASAAQLRGQPGASSVTVPTGGWAGVPETKRSNVSFLHPNTFSPWATDKELVSLPWIFKGGGDSGIDLMLPSLNHNHPRWTIPSRFLSQEL